MSVHARRVLLASCARRRYFVIVVGLVSRPSPPPERESDGIKRIKTHASSFVKISQTHVTRVLTLRFFRFVFFNEYNNSYERAAFVSANNNDNSNTVHLLRISFCSTERYD